jgi:MFS family permease
MPPSWAANALLHPARRPVTQAPGPSVEAVQRDLTAIGASVAGLLIACYQAGYGIAAFGVGPLQDMLGISLSTLLGATSLVALAMGAIAIVIVRGHTRPATMTRPAGDGFVAGIANRRASRRIGVAGLRGRRRRHFRQMFIV